METLIFLIGVTAVMAVLCLAGFVLGWFFTEVAYIPIPVKPFNCRPCLTFWLSAILNSAFALYISPLFVDSGITPYRGAALYAIIGVGVLMGLINYLYVKSKFKIYE